MAGPKKKRGRWLWIQLIVVGLLTAKLLVSGFDFGRTWLDSLFQPQGAVAQQAGQEAPEKGGADKKEAAGASKKAEQPVQEAGSKKLGPKQLELLRSIENRKKRLEEQEKELDKRSQELASLERLVDEKMATLERLRQEFEAQVKAEEARQNKRIKHLVALYSNMKPKAAAEVMEKMDLELAVGIFRQMRGREAGKVLAYVSPEKASKISQMLSEKVQD